METIITQIKKRDGRIQDFDIKKISKAILKAMTEVGEGSGEDAEEVAKLVYEKLVENCEQKDDCVPHIEQIQDIVEEKLMDADFHRVAKAYILYREKRAQERKRDIFKKRINLKPYEYPELLEYVDAIRHSYWIHTEFNYTSDIQDYKVHMTEAEKNAVKNTMLAISQIEVSVKTFWSDLYHKLPKPEIGSVGATFAESEVRHHDAYSHLLEILGLNDEFKTLKENPIIMRRVNYLESAIKHSKSDENKMFAESILLFSLFVEHVSLFSQFLIIMSFNKFKNQLKGMSNAVEATSKEEQIHGDFGIDVINIIKDEHPNWFDNDMEEEIYQVCREAYDSESDIVDWIFEKGELDFLPKKIVKEFIKNRLNNSLKAIGMNSLFEVDEKLVEETEWFDDEIVGTKHGDFFVKRSINYNKRSKSITGDDLF